MMAENRHVTNWQHIMLCTEKASSYQYQAPPLGEVRPRNCQSSQKALHPAQVQREH